MTTTKLCFDVNIGRFLKVVICWSLCLIVAMLFVICVLLNHLVDLTLNHLPNP